jgi:excinuclease ABC subunit A
VQQVILYGSGEEEIEFTYFSERGFSRQRRESFEGILPNMERRYRETDSNMVREELAKYLSQKPAPSATAHASTDPHVMSTSPAKPCRKYRPWR